MDLPKRKRIRLAAEAYLVAGSVWLVTISIQHRIHAFRDPMFGGLVASIIEVRAEETGVLLDLCCVMPDHIHLLVQVSNSSLVDYVRDVKSLTTRAWWSFGGQGALWQRSFHDRGLRTAADYDVAVAYVLHNPVEAGLTDHWETYDLIGGRLISTNDGR